ncbi:MAG: hypothetical protein EGQ83_07695 [Holdemanella biformis]|nr:hypothetical protein [Holdemanella biformis]
MSLRRDYWIAIVCKAIVILTELLITIFINRGLGVACKGDYAYIMKVVEVLYIFCSLGLGQAYATFRKKGENEFREIFVFLGLLQSALVLLIGIVIVHIFSINKGIVIVVLTSLSVLKVIFSMIAVIERNVLRNIIQVTINVLYVILLATLYFTNSFSLYFVLTCYGLMEITRILLICFLYRLKPSVKCLNLITFRQIYHTGFITMILMLLVSLNYSVDTVMIRKMSTAYSTGIYSVGVNFSSMFLMIPDAFKDVLFGDASKKNFDSHLAYTAIKISIGISIIGILGWLVFGKFIITLLYGKEYLNSYLVTTILFFGCISLPFFKILQPIFIADGNQVNACIYLSISVIINIIANYLLIPHMDFIGASIASVISYSICGGFFLIKYRLKTMKEFS